MKETGSFPFAVGDSLYHRSNAPIEKFDPAVENLIYFGTNPQCLEDVGAAGCINRYEIIDFPSAPLGQYGSRNCCGILVVNGGYWLSVPSEITDEFLEYVDSVSDEGIDIEDL